MEKELKKCIKNFHIYIPNIEKHLSVIDEDANNIEKIKQVYTFTKQISPYLYKNGYMHSSYRYLKETILDFEYNLLPKEFIIESNPIFSTKEQIAPNLDQHPTAILSYIVNETRKFLIAKHAIRKQEENINNLSFANDCQDASRKVKELCDTHGIKSERIIIHPGYCEEEFLYNGSCFHFINIIYLNGKKYLVDCTYRQFFTLRENTLERIGIVDLSGCKPGIFMTMTESRKNIATQILKYGWIELTDDILKDYLDGFTLSYRNGLYYEKTNDFSFTAPYTAVDYKRFLKGFDDQINHEGREVLGYQKKPLKHSLF